VQRFLMIVIVCSIADGAPRVFAQNAENNANMNENINSPNNNESIGEENGENDTDEVDVPSDDKKNMPHPEGASRWRTRDLVLVKGYANAGTLQACQGEVLALTLRAQSDEGLLSARNFLTKSLVSKVEDFHWCFYISMMQLDDRLLNQKVPVQNRYQDYVNSMKQLWVLAAALDAALMSKKYIGYLRRRYKELSVTHFGRHLTVITAPLGDSENRSVLQHLNKAAGPAPR
jgi:hypothetical protein